jgi:sugar phosphate isomerase/epimerase
MDIGPFELIEVAAQCGYQAVSLFTNAPHVPISGQEGKFSFPTVTADMAREIKSRIDGHGLAMVNAEFFLLRAEVDIVTYQPGLALGRELGARHAISHVFEPDPTRAADLIGRFCDLAAAEDMVVALEFCPMTPGCKSLSQAKWFVEQVGRANLGFGICPMHLIRSGGSAAQIVALDPAMLLYGQLNDGLGLHRSEAYFDEVHDRQLPGAGNFPLADIVRALPASAPIEVKCPSDSRRQSGVSALDYARDALVRARKICE